jgi:hypothetical protein
MAVKASTNCSITNQLNPARVLLMMLSTIDRPTCATHFMVHLTKIRHKLFNTLVKIPIKLGL